MRPDSLPFPRAHSCAGLSIIIRPPLPTAEVAPRPGLNMGWSSAGSSSMQVKGPELAQWSLSSAAHQRVAAGLPGTVTAPHATMSLKRDWGLCTLISTPGVSSPLLPTPLRQPMCCMGQPSSGELDLGVKAQRQGGLQADCSWPCAGRARLPRGPFCLPEWISDVALPTARDGLLACSRGPRGSCRPHLAVSSSSSSCLPVTHQARCFPSALYICYESSFPD